MPGKVIQKPIGVCRHAESQIPVRAQPAQDVSTSQSHQVARYSRWLGPPGVASQEAPASVSVCPMQCVPSMLQDATGEIHTIEKLKRRSHILRQTSAVLRVETCCRRGGVSKIDEIRRNPGDEDTRVLGLEVEP